MGVIILQGALSFYKATAEIAFNKSQGTKYPDKDVASAKPSLVLNIDKGELKKFLEVAEHVVENAAALSQGEYGALTRDDADDILAGLASQTWQSKLYQLPVKDVTEFIQDNRPDAVASLSVKGFAGGKFNEYCLALSADALVNQGAFKGKASVPINESVHSLYEGCVVRVPVSVETYYSAKPGVLLRASKVYFLRDDEPFGGSISGDADELLAD